MDSDFSSSIRQFNEWQLATFTAAQAERMFPNFSLFANVTEAADAVVMRTALDQVWEHLCQRGNCNIEAQLLRVEEQTPDVEQFDIYGVYPALDAAVALAATLEQLSHPSVEEAINIYQLSEECIATYLEVSADASLSDEELVRFINTHELMDQQLTFTEELIKQLLGMETPKAAVIDQLRDLAANQGVSNIGICDED